ncbi:MAG: hypothetical protein V9G15_03305 [Dermatophilaceae bacterium]
MGDVEFSYAADTLMRCVYDVRVITSSVREGTVDGLEDGVDFGHEELAGVAGDFCARWNQGLKVLVDGNEWLGDQLAEAVREYVSADAQAAEVFARLMGSLERGGL